ncbi:MAG: hypothetical protein RR273_01970, partial [Oscillospiraceae bacterium]
ATKPYKIDLLLSRLKNIIKERELEEKFAPQYDKLTGIYSASAFFEATEQLISKNKDIQYVLVRWNIERF